MSYNSVFLKMGLTAPVGGLAWGLAKGADIHAPLGVITPAVVAEVVEVKAPTKPAKSAGLIKEEAKAASRETRRLAREVKAALVEKSTKAALATALTRVVTAKAIIKSTKASLSKAVFLAGKAVRTAKALGEDGAKEAKKAKKAVRSAYKRFSAAKAALNLLERQRTEARMSLSVLKHRAAMLASSVAKLAKLAKLAK